MSAGISISFKNQITGFAKANDLDLTQEGIETLNSVLRSTMRLDGEHVSFVIGDGRTGTVEEAIALHSEGAPRKKASSAPAGKTATAKAMAKVQEARAGQSAAATQAAAAGGNPWAAATFNRTACAIIQNNDPQLATRLRVQAGARQ